MEPCRWHYGRRRTEKNLSSLTCGDRAALAASTCAFSLRQYPAILSPQGRSGFCATYLVRPGISPRQLESSQCQSASFLEDDWRENARRRGSGNRLGFAHQFAFVRVLGRFPRQEPLEIDHEILRFAALQSGADPETIQAYAGRRQTVSEHQQHIRDYLRLRIFETDAGERLTRYLEGEALRLDRTASLPARASAWLRDERVLAPADYLLRRTVASARQRAARS